MILVIQGIHEFPDLFFTQIGRIFRMKMFFEEEKPDQAIGKHEAAYAQQGRNMFENAKSRNDQTQTGQLQLEVQGFLRSVHQRMVEPGSVPSGRKTTSTFLPFSVHRIMPSLFSPRSSAGSRLATTTTFLPTRSSGL